MSGTASCHGYWSNVISSSNCSGKRPAMIAYHLQPTFNSKTFDAPLVHGRNFAPHPNFGHPQGCVLNFLNMVLSFGPSPKFNRPQPICVTKNLNAYRLDCDHKMPGM